MEKFLNTGRMVVESLGGRENETLLFNTFANAYGSTSYLRARAFKGRGCKRTAS